MVFVQNNQLVSCSSDKTVKSWTWDLMDENNFRVSELEDENGGVIYDLDYRKQVLITGDGNVRTVDFDNYDKLKDVVGRVSVYEFFGSIRRCVLSPDSKLLLTGGDDDKVPHLVHVIIVTYNVICNYIF